MCVVKCVCGVYVCVCDACVWWLWYMYMCIWCVYKCVRYMWGDMSVSVRCVYARCVWQYVCTVVCMYDGDMCDMYLCV